MLIPNVSKQTIEKLKERLMQDHQTAVTAQLTPDTPGQIQGHGAILDYVYNEPAQTLTVTVKHHPFYIPGPHVEHSIMSYVDEIRPAAYLTNNEPQAQEA